MPTKPKKKNIEVHSEFNAELNSMKDYYVENERRSEIYKEIGLFNFANSVSDDFDGKIVLANEIVSMKISKNFSDQRRIELNEGSQYSAKDVSSMFSSPHRAGDGCDPFKRFQIINDEY
jgi:hypothetical protein